MRGHGRGKERSAPPGCTSETQKLREDNTAYLNRFAKRENDNIYGRAAAKKIADPDHVVNSASTYIRLAQTAD